MVEFQRVWANILKQKGAYMNNKILTWRKSQIFNQDRLSIRDFIHDEISAEQRVSFDDEMRWRREVKGSLIAPSTFVGPLLAWDMLSFSVDDDMQLTSWFHFILSALYLGTGSVK